MVMAKTYEQLSREIAALQATADEMRQAEDKAVIAQINDAIAKYDLTPADFIFNGHTNAEVSKKNAEGTRNQQTPPGLAPNAKFSDGQGNTWSGRGPRPRWLQDALTKGTSLDTFASHRSQPRPDEPLVALPAEKKRKSSSAGKKVPAKYHDTSTGDSWSGRGIQPTWLKTAIQKGRRLDSFLIDADLPPTTLGVTRRSKQPRPRQQLPR
jgi:DNA-binding protein H-NS